MVRIRLRKTGRKRINSFRIVAVESNKPRDSLAELHNLGYYLPQNKKKYLSIDISTTQALIKNGAQPSERVRKLIAIAEKNEEHRRKDKTNNTNVL